MEQPNNEASVIKLLSCPFCGSDEIVFRESTDEMLFNTFWVECYICEVGTKFGPGKAEAAKTWNTRVNRDDGADLCDICHEPMVSDDPTERMHFGVLGIHRKCIKTETKMLDRADEAFDRMFVEDYDNAPNGIKWLFRINSDGTRSIARAEDVKGFIHTVLLGKELLRGNQIEVLWDYRDKPLPPDEAAAPTEEKKDE